MFETYTRLTFRVGKTSRRGHLGGLNYILSWFGWIKMYFEPENCPVLYLELENWRPMALAKFKRPSAPLEVGIPESQKEGDQGKPAGKILTAC